MIYSDKFDRDLDRLKSYIGESLGRAYKDFKDSDHARWKAEEKANLLEKEIENLLKIQKMLVNHLDWDSLDYGELEIARELHIKYYPDNRSGRQ